MTLNFHKTRFLTSAANSSHLPPDTGAEVAFVGRSNVGKSSALNVLTQQKNLARTSKTPGRTQLINFFTVCEDIRLVDLPGYGYAKVAKSLKEEWGKNLEEYLANRNCLKGMVLLVDIRHSLKAFDEMMLDWAGHQQIPVHIVLTKADKLSRGKALSELHKLKTRFETQGQHNVTLQSFSALNKTGLEALQEKLSQWLPG